MTHQGPTPKPKQRQVEVKLDPSAELPPPEGANFFHFTVIGTEVQLLVGAVNLLQVHESGSTDGKIPRVEPAVTHRFLLSPFAFAQLKTQVENVASAVAPPGATFKSHAK